MATLTATSSAFGFSGCGGDYNPSPFKSRFKPLSAQSTAADPLVSSWQEAFRGARQTLTSDIQSRNAFSDLVDQASSYATGTTDRMPNFNARSLRVTTDLSDLTNKTGSLMDKIRKARTKGLLNPEDIDSCVSEMGQELSAAISGMSQSDNGDGVETSAGQTSDGEPSSPSPGASVSHDDSFDGPTPVSPSLTEASPDRATTFTAFTASPPVSPLPLSDGMSSAIETGPGYTSPTDDNSQSSYADYTSYDSTSITDGASRSDSLSSLDDSGSGLYSGSDRTKGSESGSELEHWGSSSLSSESVQSSDDNDDDSAWPRSQSVFSNQRSHASSARFLSSPPPTPLFSSAYSESFD